VLAVRDLPNVLTVLRMLLVAPLVWLLMTGHFEAALVLALVAGISDWLDGWLARRFHWQSRFGGMLDPLADKLLMIATYAALTWLGALPGWLFWLVVARDLAIVTGGVLYHRMIEPFRAEPTRLSKLNTLCQVLLMWTVLTVLAGWTTGAALVDALVVVVALTVAATLVQYVVLWGLRARRLGRAATGARD